MRVEFDSMGEVHVPDEALWGASTERALLAFGDSGLRLPPSLIEAIGVVKLAAVRANRTLGRLDFERGDAIESAALEVAQGKWSEHFVIDLFQSGSGTPTNMNVNEVIANRALDILGKKRGNRLYINPNDHVNLGQSSNDVFPSAIHIASYSAIKARLLPSLRELGAAIDSKSKEFVGVVKAGRTHLQDAAPITLGQEFSGYAAQIKQGISAIESSANRLLELALGGTAVGTGLNAPAEFVASAIAEIVTITGYPFKEAKNHFAAQASIDTALEVSGQLRVVAVSLIKIANDLRWLASGPRCGLGEIYLPETQPGSSIMPGKVNPVLCESLMMVCAKVIGNDATAAICGQHGNFELNTMMPILAHNLLESIELLAGNTDNFSRGCVVGIRANVERCSHYAQRSLGRVAALVPVIGYDRAAEVARRAIEGDKVAPVIGDYGGDLTQSELSQLLDPMTLTQRLPGDGASQFSNCLLRNVGSFKNDKNVRADDA